MNEPMTVADAGRKGGQNTLKNKGKEYFKEISRLGVEARKKKQLASK